MKTFFCILISLTAVAAQASERSYFYCSSDSAEFQTVIVKQVITNNGGTVSSTFKIDVSDETGVVTPYWQDGDVQIGSDDTFRGPFKAGNRIVAVDIKAPTFPNYKPRVSTLTDGSTLHQMNCNSL